MTQVRNPKVMVIDTSHEGTQHAVGMLTSPTALWAR